MNANTELRYQVKLSAIGASQRTYEHTIGSYTRAELEELYADSGFRWTSTTTAEWESVRSRQGKRTRVFATLVSCGERYEVTTVTTLPSGAIHKMSWSRALSKPEIETHYNFRGYFRDFAWTSDTSATVQTMTARGNWHDIEILCEPLTPA